MKVIVKHFLNVRAGKPSVNAPCYQYLAPGSEIEVDGNLYQGDRFEEIDTWLKDEAENYYWRGGTDFQLNIDAALAISQPQSKVKKSAQWHEKLKIREIWDTYNERGNSVTIAVLDTGINKSNLEVASGIVAERVLINSTSYPGIELRIDDQSNEGHGTRCSSIIGARNKLEPIIGIAPECKLISGKISIAREVRNFDFVLAGIEWAIKEGAEVISISYAIELPENQKAQWEEKFQSLIGNKNILIFAAAGNSGSTQISGERYPASFDNCISVGATDKNNNLSAINILSDKTIIHAPGIEIESYGKSNIPDAQSGTSYATPIVAGIVGLGISFLKKKNGNWNKKELLTNLFNSAYIMSGTISKKSINAIEFFKKLKN